MKAGRELDALVAEKVMGNHGYCAKNISDYTNPDGTHPTATIGWMLSLEEAQEICKEKGDGWFPCAESPHSYSTQIADAWEVVEHLTTGGEWNYKFGIQILSDGWWANFMVGLEPNHHADTAPLAICIAALKAVGVTPTQEETP